MADLLDQYGRPIRKAELKRELAGPTLTGARTIHSSYNQVGPDPRRLAWVLREAESGDPIRYLELAEQMEEKDLHYLSVLGTRRRQVSQLKVSVEPSDDSAEAEADAEILRQWHKRMELEDELFDLMDAVGKGFAVCEIVWDVSESQWLPTRLVYRLPQWFRYDWETGTRLQRRDDTHQWVDLEPGKFVVHRHQAKSGLPIRGGIARAAAWAWAFKNFGIRDWLRFVEAYGHPLRVGKFHRGATDTEQNTLYRAVKNIASDAAAIVPEGMVIEFIESSGTGVRADLYKDLLGYMDAAISKAVLGQTLTTQEGDSGSYSLGQVHDEVRQDIERSDARQLAATLTNAVGRPLVLLNRGDPGRRGFPRFTIGREDEYDPAAMADALSKLLPHGLRVKASQVRMRLGLDDPEDDDEILAGSMSQSGPGDPDNPLPAEMARALARAATAGGSSDAIDAAIEDLLAGNGWEPLMDPLVEPILQESAAAARRGENLDGFRDRLPELFSGMNDAALIQTLRRMGFSAALSGDAGLEDDGET